MLLLLRWTYSTQLGRTEAEPGDSVAGPCNAPRRPA